MRSEIVHRTKISYHVAEEESTYSKAEIKNLSRGNTTDLPFKGVEMTEEEGREREGRTVWTDDVMDGGKGSEMEYLKFSTPYFLTIYRNFHNSGFSWQAKVI